MQSLHLIPPPKIVKLAKNSLPLPADPWIIMDPRLRDTFAAELFIIDAEPLTHSTFHLTLGKTSTTPHAEIRILLNPAAAKKNPQGYHLDITPTGIELSASTSAGIFYAFQTLLQIIRQSAYTHSSIENRKSKIKNQNPLSLPCLSIRDWPDFPRRGAYHDTARGKVPTVDTLLQLIDDLGHLKYNEFQLYIENNFEFRKHPAMYDDTNPFTAEELLLLDAACRVRHIDFIPSLTSLGHFEKILSRPAFRHLAEVEPEALKKAGIKIWSEQPWTLCVTDPQARQLLKDMYDEFVPNFTSPTFNICCDESWDMGKGRSKKLLAKIGPGQMYVNWVNHCNALAKFHGKKIQMWGDIILNHPELIPQLPDDATLLEWGYESHHKFDEHLATFKQRIDSVNKSKIENRKSKMNFYAAPGTTSWLSLAARTRNAFGNIHNACSAGLKHGAAGILVTDWGDNGHQQLLAVSLLPFAYGAAASWNLAATPNPAIAKAPDWETGIVPAGTKSADAALAPFLAGASLHLFQDPTATFATHVYSLGLTYERFSWQRFNGSLEWFLFREKWDFANYVNRAKPADLPKVIAACQKLRKQFHSAILFHPEADQLKAELILTCDQIIHTCRRTALRQLWLAADPAKRNPEEKSLRDQPAKPFPKSFPTQMRRLAAEAGKLEKRYAALWLARNKPSRLADILTEFHRLQNEYKKFSH